jgi:hypothetical protein
MVSPTGPKAEESERSGQVPLDVPEPTKDAAPRSSAKAEESERSGQVPLDVPEPTKDAAEGAARFQPS